MRSLFVPILILLVLGRVGAESDNEVLWKGFSVSCLNDESGQLVNNVSVSCHGIRLVRKIVQKLLEDAKRKKNMEFINGISLVDREDGQQSSRNSRFLRDYSSMGNLVKWLEGRELRIKLPTLLPGNLENVIEQSLPSSDEEKSRKSGGGFGGGLGGKGDGGGAMLMALMMGKMMAAMGFGALGLLAMKALMISALALMLSLIVAAKKMSGGKDEESHHVVYAQEVSHGHHRRRRSLENDKNYPYRGYVAFPTDATKITE